MGLAAPQGQGEVFSKGEKMEGTLLRKFGELIATVLVAAIAVPAVAQDFPTRTLRFYVGFVPGTGSDLVSPSGGAAFPALCPAMVAVLAIPILGEWPTSTDWIAIILISAGVYAVSGGPLPGRRGGISGAEDSPTHVRQLP